MSRILIVNGHPDPETSVANAAVIREFLQLCPSASVRNLAEVRTSCGFDIAREQAELADADIIIWQFPFYWYSVPALMKKWIDEVLTCGFAYGTGGTTLKGKKLIVSTTAAGADEDYVPGGVQGFAPESFMPAFEQTARMCSMKFAAVFSGGMCGPRSSIEEKAHDHARRLFAAVTEN